MSVDQVVEAYQIAKSALAPNDTYLRALIHVHVGLAIFFGSMLVFRKPFGSALPIGLVWAVTALGEGADLYAHWPVQHAWVWRDLAGDVFHTLLWPTLLFLVACMRSYLRERAERAREAKNQDSEAETGRLADDTAGAAPIRETISSDNSELPNLER